MTTIELLRVEDLDSEVALPPELRRIAAQGLVDLTPWHIMDRTLAIDRMRSMRERYVEPYVPFAMRQDSDDLACIVPAEPGKVIIIHDFASAGFERRREFSTFWEWFRTAIEDMIVFDEVFDDVY